MGRGDCNDGQRVSLRRESLVPSGGLAMGATQRAIHWLRLGRNISSDLGKGGGAVYRLGTDRSP